MAKPIFNSSLSTEEIENNFENTDCFSVIVEGLKNALSYENIFDDTYTTARSFENKD